MRGEAGAEGGCVRDAVSGEVPALRAAGQVDGVHVEVEAVGVRL